MIATQRLNIYVATQKEMENFIAGQTDDIMKAAYTEMLDGSLRYPEQREWYAIWMMERKDGTYVGDLCFKGLDANGVTEIGYGISDEYQNQGYATEAVKAAVAWAFRQPGVTTVEAETEPDNKASQRVLEKCGFVRSGKMGAEGPRFK